MRVPAGELEGLVCRRLASFFASDAELGDRLIGRDAEMVARGISSGQKNAAALRRNDPQEAHQILRAIDLKVQVGADKVNMVLAPLRAVQPDADDAGECASISVPAKLAYRGPDLRFAIPPDQPVEASRKDATLIKLMVAAHEARGMLVDGKKSAVVERYGEAHLARLARLAFLAPDIVSGIMDGKQPVTLTSRKLLRATHIPLNWVEQRRILGFS